MKFPSKGLVIFTQVISKKTKYGLKALSYIAKHGSASTSKIQIPEIAKDQSIPRKFLESILLELRKAGYLGSQKGKTGGYYLMKSADQITIAEIYRILEGPIAPVPCVSLNFYEKCEDCSDEDVCPVHNLMIQARDASLSIYTKKTVADLIV